MLVESQRRKEGVAGFSPIPQNFQAKRVSPSIEVDPQPKVSFPAPKGRESSDGRRMQSCRLRTPCIPGGEGLLLGEEHSSLRLIHNPDVHYIHEDAGCNPVYKGPHAFRARGRGVIEVGDVIPGPT